MKDIAEEIVGYFPYLRDVIEKQPIIAAEQDGSNVLILSKLEEPFTLWGGDTAIYALEYRWLSNEDDLSAVQGSEYIYVTKNEYKDGVSLFEQFDLF